MKIYKKVHTNQKALKAHIKKIEQRGGGYSVVINQIRYAFPEDDSLPKNIQQLVDDGKVTYRGGEFGTLIRVKKVEYLITSEKFRELGWIKKIKFHAPFRTENDNNEYPDF